MPYCFCVFSAIYRWYPSDMAAWDNMSKKLLFISLRMSEDLKKQIEKKVAVRRRKKPWASESEAGYIREAIVYYLRHEDTGGEKSDTKTAPDI